MASKVINLLDVEDLDLDPITKEALRALLDHCGYLSIEVVCYTYAKGHAMFQLRRGDRKMKLADLNYHNLNLINDALQLIGTWNELATASRPIGHPEIVQKLQELHDLAAQMDGELTWTEDGSRVTYGRPIELSWKRAYDPRYPHAGPNCKFKIPEQIRLLESFVQHDANLRDL